MLLAFVSPQTGAAYHALSSRPDGDKWPGAGRGGAARGWCGRCAQGAGARYAVRERGYVACSSSKLSELYFGTRTACSLRFAACRESEGIESELDKRNVGSRLSASNPDRSAK